LSSLPPGPREPRAVQTVEWIARPTAFLRRCARVHGEPFTLRTHWADAPMVLVSAPDDVKRVFGAGLDGAGSGSILVPFAGRHSILVLDGEEHLAQRRRMLPPFHGDRMRERRELVASLAREELSGWRGEVKTHERMQALTLEVMMQVVFGRDDARLREAIASTLSLARSAPRLVVMALGAKRGFERAVARVDEVIYEAIDSATGATRRAGTPETLLDELIAVSSSREEVRDQLVTLLAAGHETTATALAWAFERLGRHPEVVERLGEREYRGWLVNEVLRVRPVLSVAPRKLTAPFDVAGHTLPPGTHVAPCIYLAHRRADTWGDPLTFRPERWADPPPSYAFIPFGGGTRRCLGAAFATMEMEAVLDEAAKLGTIRSDPERVRRRAVTLSPARGGRVRVG
jgi:cytochrome P450